MSKLEIEFWFSAEYTVGQFNDLVDKIIAIYLCQSQLGPGRFVNIAPSAHILMPSLFLLSNPSEGLLSVGTLALTR